jgi:DnaJ-class molecular chaperone
MTVAERAVPLRTRRTFACNTCGDKKVVSRIRGGVTFSQPCPDCNGGSW